MGTNITALASTVSSTTSHSNNKSSRNDRSGIVANCPPLKAHGTSTVPLRLESCSSKSVFILRTELGITGIRCRTRVLRAPIYRQQWQNICPVAASNCITSNGTKYRHFSRQNSKSMELDYNSELLSVTKWTDTHTHNMVDEMVKKSGARTAAGVQVRLRGEKAPRSENTRNGNG